jgi:hypothetical protein
LAVNQERASVLLGNLHALNAQRVRKTRGAMIYADAAESVAELILKEHRCGRDCLCWELRKVPAINEEIRKLHVQKLQQSRSPEGKQLIVGS